MEPGDQQRFGALSLGPLGRLRSEVKHPKVSCLQEDQNTFLQLRHVLSDPWHESGHRGCGSRQKGETSVATRLADRGQAWPSAWPCNAVLGADPHAHRLSGLLALSQESPLA